MAVLCWPVTCHRSSAQVSHSQAGGPHAEPLLMLVTNSIKLHANGFVTLHIFLKTNCFNF